MLPCPKGCKSPDTAVIDSRAAKDGTQIRRRRKCKICGHRFTTYERIILAPEKEAEAPNIAIANAIDVCKESANFLSKADAIFSGSILHKKMIVASKQSARCEHCHQGDRHV